MQVFSLASPNRFRHSNDLCCLVPDCALVSLTLDTDADRHNHYTGTNEITMGE